MKTILVFLLLSVYSQEPTVKQYKLTEVYEENKLKLVFGYVAITKDTLYIRENDQAGAFLVDTVLTIQHRETTILFRDTLILGEPHIVYFGRVVDYPEAKGIYFEIINPSCGCRIERRYKYK